MKVFDVIKKFYTDPELGFISRQKLLKKIRDYGYDIKMKDINAFYPFKSKASKDINPILRQFIQNEKDDGKK